MDSENKVVSDAPTPIAVRVGRLDCASGIAREMGRVYRAARGGKLDVQDACRFTYMLSCMGRLFEAVELVKRIESIEAKVANAARTQQAA